MDQRIGPIDEVITVVTQLVDGTIDWKEACIRLPAYDGVQAVDWSSVKRTIPCIDLPVYKAEWSSNYIDWLKTVFPNIEVLKELSMRVMSQA